MPLYIIVAQYDYMLQQFHYSPNQYILSNSEQQNPGIA